MPETFDYVVVGGGTAGCVVAARLSQERNASVLLVEAGPRKMPLVSRVPLMVQTLKRHPQLDWGYISEPEPRAANRRFLRSHGKGLGGSSGINGMIVVRGHPQDYDDWASLGLPGWGYDDLLPFFRRAETNWRGAGPEHGGDGPWHVGPGAIGHPFVEMLKETARAAGRPILDDLATPEQEGLGVPDFSIAGGMRVSMARAYLPLAGPGLKILAGTQVNRVIVEGARAVGIEIVQDGIVSRIDARSEVILSAGGYNSAKILLQSGIGDAETLRSAGVAPIHHLPGVGRNLQGHVSAPLRYRYRGPRSFHSELRFDRLAISALRWAITRQGVFAGIPPAVLSYVRSRDGLDRPDIQVLYTTGRFDDAPWFPMIRPGMGSFIWSSLSLCRPRSRGSVTLRSPDPFDAPRIQYNLLEDPDDMARLRDAVRRERQFYRTHPLGSQLGDEDLPGEAYGSDAELDTRLREVVTSGQHPTSTCAMGTGPDAVTDAELRVHGLASLRIADASVMPLMVSGNTYATVVMIGEKAADLIRRG